MQWWTISPLYFVRLWRSWLFFYAHAVKENAEQARVVSSLEIRHKELAKEAVEPNKVSKDVEKRAAHLTEIENRYEAGTRTAAHKYKIEIAFHLMYVSNLPQ